MKRATTANTLNKQLWDTWSQDQIFNEQNQRADLGLDVTETEQFNAYMGMMLLDDVELVKAHLRTAHVQGKVSDRLLEAVMGAISE